MTTVYTLVLAWTLWTTIPKMRVIRSVASAIEPSMVSTKISTLTSGTKLLISGKVSKHTGQPMAVNLGGRREAMAILSTG